VKIIGVIPARLNSTRLPLKPLHPICGKPLVQWVYEGASQYPYFDRLVVATDSEMIQEKVKEFGGKVAMTSCEHTSGTSRMYEVASETELKPDDILVNIQGDEPLINGQVLNILLNNNFKNNKEIGASTVARKFVSEEEKKSPHYVKAIIDKNGYALDFTRKWKEEFSLKTVLCHIGLYAYKKWALDQFMKLPPTVREREEKLEQLRFADNLNIFHVSVVKDKLIGVDTIEDVKSVENELRKQ